MGVIKTGFFEIAEPVCRAKISCFFDIPFIPFAFQMGKQCLFPTQNMFRDVIVWLFP